MIVNLALVTWSPKPVVVVVVVAARLVFDLCFLSSLFPESACKGFCWKEGASYYTYTSSHLHILHLQISTSSHLHTFTSSQTFSSSHLSIPTSSYLHHLHFFTSLYLHIITSSHLTRAHLRPAHLRRSLPRSSYLRPSHLLIRVLCREQTYLHIACMNSTKYHRIILILVLPRTCLHRRFSLSIRMGPPSIMCWTVPVTEPNSIQGFNSIAANKPWTIHRPSIKGPSSTIRPICWALFYSIERTQPMHPQSSGHELSVSLQKFGREKFRTQ